MERAQKHSFLTRAPGCLASQVALVVKNPSANAGDVNRHRFDPWVGMIPVLRRYPGGGHSNPLQYSCWIIPRDRGSWRAAVHRVAQSPTWLKRLSMQTCSVTKLCPTLCDPTAACLSSLSTTISQSLLKLMYIESVMPSKRLNLCHPLLLLYSVFPSIRICSNVSALPIRGPKYDSLGISKI